jgi:hypothetical protein
MEQLLNINNKIIESKISINIEHQNLRDVACYIEVCAFMSQYVYYHMFCGIAISVKKAHTKS